MGIEIHDYSTGEQPEGETWTTETLQRDFIVHDFVAPYVRVTRKSDNKQGMLQFSHNPRVYWGFE